MRSALLIFATLVLIVCGFVIYSQFQGPRTPHAQRPAGPTMRGPTTIPTPGSATQPVVGAGDDVWVTRFHPRTGDVTSRFRAARYDPKPDGRVEVDRPIAEFMLSRGRIVRIEGKSGSVVMPSPPPKSVEREELQTPTPLSPPNRGQLKDVVISLFEAAPAEGEPPRPSMTVTMNNCSFDNDTFLIRTEAYEEDGKRVEADEVPVKVRGVDYDFDGRGLTIQWNELDQKLQLLEIAHGESLTVKNPGDLESMRDVASTPPAPAVAPAPAVPPPPAQSATTATAPSAAARARQRRRKAAAAAAAAAAPGAPAPPTPAPATSPTAQGPAPYRASFERDLRIVQGDVDVATGDLMQVDFAVEDEHDESTDEPADGASAPQEKSSAARKLRPKPSIATPTAQEGEAAPPQPVIVRWTGRLRVVPLEPSADVPLAADEQVVRLSGAPLRLLRDGANIEAAGATYRASDGTVSLRASDEVPRVTLRDAKGAIVSTPALTYAEDANTGTLTGPSSAQIPMGSGDARDTLLATWNEECLLSLPKDARGHALIRGATLKGSVAIAHPRMDLNSDNLELAFATPTTQPAEGADHSPQLEKLIATGSVIAKLKETDAAAERSVQAKKLELRTEAAPDGRLLPRTILADGEVLLSEPTQSMRAEHLEATLAPKPTTAPSDPATAPATTQSAASDMPELIVESVVAQGNVRLTGEKGATATAEQLQAVERDGQSLIQLMGVPAAPATVSDGKNTLTGQIMKLLPREQKAEVPGGGSLSFVREEKDGTTSPPVNASWSGHALLDGHENRLDLHKDVSFRTTDADGTTTTSDSEHLQLTLADKPTTQPSDATTQPATAPTTQPTGGGLGDLRGMDFLANKEPRAAKLTGDVRIESTLPGAEGAVFRRMYLRTPEANYDMASRQMTVPTSGRLLYEDHRPPDQADANDNDPTGGATADRGMTAFLWNKSLTYDDAAQRAVMEGDVDINHVPDDKNSPPFRIATQRVIAELVPKPATQPATAEATTSPAAIAPSVPLARTMQLKRVTAEGGVNVVTKRFQFTAVTVAFTPADGVLSAQGSPGQPMTFTDEQGQGEGSIESLIWNTKTDQLTLKRTRGRLRP